MGGIQDHSSLSLSDPGACKLISVSLFSTHVSCVLLCGVDTALLRWAGAEIGLLRLVSAVIMGAATPMVKQ